jgi:uncharacterized protein YbjT (DUF2867 family)
MILVIGATGNVGNELVRALLRAGEPVRALVRNARRSLPNGVEGVVGDLNDPDSMADALTGVKGVFLLSGYEDMPGLLARIERAGAERVVLLSGGAAVARDLENPISRYMIASEEAVRQAGPAWTILRPCEFMSNALRWRPQLLAGDLVRVPFADLPVAVVDPFDIAAVAATALLSGDHDGRAYRLTGPQSLLPEERVRILGSVLGRTLRFEALSDDEAEAELGASMPPEYVKAFLSFSVDGALDESIVLPTVTEVTRTPPRTFEQWANAHKQEFQ